ALVWGADSKRIRLVQVLDGKKLPSPPPPLPALAFPLLPPLMPLLLSLCVLSSPLSIPASRISLHFLLPPPRFPHPRAPFSSDPPHLRAQGCIPAELSLRGSAAPPSGQSRDRRGVSHTRKTRVLLCLLQKTQRCPPTWPAPTARSQALFCALNGLEGGRQWGAIAIGGQTGVTLQQAQKRDK
ncbi:unnamed protein product, partial [Rangifer tarandus platyrhynchus]